MDILVFLGWTALAVAAVVGALWWFERRLRRSRRVRGKRRRRR